MKASDIIFWILFSLAILAIVFMIKYALAAESFAIKLNWRDRSKVESGFYVYRDRDASGSFEKIATLKPNITTFVDNDATKLSCYRVSSFRERNKLISESWPTPTRCVYFLK